jgi:hypothetical protein
MNNKELNNIVVIGDVHGCAAELRELIASCAGKRFVFAGDLVHRGPDSEGVLEIVAELASEGRLVAVVEGNHEIRAASAGETDEWGASWERVAPWLTPAILLGETLIVHGGLDWRAAELMHAHAGEICELGAARAFFAGLKGKKKKAASKLAFVRKLKSGGGFASIDEADRLGDKVDWWGAWWVMNAPGDTPFTRVLYGHSATEGDVRVHQQTHYDAYCEGASGGVLVIGEDMIVPEITIGERVTFSTHGIDTGCVYGHALTAIDLSGEVVAQVRAERAYATHAA